MKEFDEKIKLLQQILMNVPFDGWSSPSLIKDSAAMIDADPALFKDAIDVMQFWGEWMNHEMDERLKDQDLQSMRIRDRIALMVRTRLEILTPYRESVKLALSYLARPENAIRMKGPELLWRGADHMWYQAGDTSTDYNHYTKRLLLSGVMMSTTLFWLRDTSDDYQKTRAFLDDRIENVMQFGKFTGKAKAFIQSVLPFQQKTR